MQSWRAFFDQAAEVVAQSTENRAKQEASGTN
jgi:hypothetical protein